MSWNIYDLFIWAQLELQLGIMCAAAPSLRVFFRRYLGNSFASRAYKSTRGETPGPLTKNTQNTGVSSVDQADKSITVIRSTSVTFNHDEPTNKKAFSESLDTIGETDSQDRNWSPTPSKERLTRYSHEEDYIALKDMPPSWVDPGHSQNQHQHQDRAGWV